VGEVWVGLKHKSLLLDWPKSSYQSRMYGFRYVVWNVHVALGYMDFTTTFVFIFVITLEIWFHLSKLNHNLLHA
jgi:hypothetical protein